MKKIFTTLVIMAFTVSLLIGQTQAPNGGFENWDNNNKPTSWGCSNIQIIPIVDYKVVFKESTDPHSGTYCAKLQSLEYSTAGITRVVPSFITLGTFWFTINPQAGGYKGGIAFTERPDSIAFYYKSNTKGSDVAMFTYQSWKGAQTAGNVVASDTGTLLPNAATWTKVVLPFVYYSTQNPDSLNIVFSASNLGNELAITDSSTLWIDDASLIYNNIGIVDINYNENFYVYANESNLMVSLSFEKETKSDVSVYNIAGQEVFTTSVSAQKTTVAVPRTRLEKGVYLVTVNAGNGKKFTQKIVVN